ncbi:MAG: protein-L-isoaspartate O-methyltransferase family protein [Steroidobacteraceae bacterium]
MTLTDSPREQEAAREQMVQQQVRAWDVLDERVLDVFRRIPRERFVPEQHRYLAFADVSIPLPHDQHMLRPNVAGRLLQALELTGSEQVLEIGTGSGFVTACLAATAASVRSLEIFPDLAEAARTHLAALGVRNAEVVTADASRLDGSERYDAIALTASLPVYDDRFQRRLTVGGRLFAVVGNPPVMEACLIRCVAESAYARETLFETVVDPLINAPRPRAFTF